MVILSDDLYEYIFSTDLMTGIGCRTVSKRIMQIVDCLTNGVVVRCEKNVISQGHLLEILPLTVAEAQQLPFECVKRGSSYGWVHLFRLTEILPRVLSPWLGMKELAARLHTRAAKKRKREENEQLGIIAAAKRRAKLDAWLAARDDAPNSVEEWSIDLKTRMGNTSWCPVLLRFFNTTKTGPSFKEAIKAAEAHLKKTSSQAIAEREKKREKCS
jgi:hypothetical protein